MSPRLTAQYLTRASQVVTAGGRERGEFHTGSESFLPEVTCVTSAHIPLSKSSHRATANSKWTGKCNLTIFLKERKATLFSNSTNDDNNHFLKRRLEGVLTQELTEK